MKKTLFVTAALVLCVLIGASAPALADKGGTPQASITLKNSNAALCYTNNTEWTLEKTADSSSVDSGGTASWTVKVIKGDTSNNFITVKGFVSVQNTGSADATIGNIVVNLQRKEGKKWVTQSSDVADATSGDFAETAYISPSASSEGIGYFTENEASGKLEFTLTDNTVWALTTVADKTIQPGEIVNLVFSAQFDNTELEIPEGELIRAEVIVSFGNSGGRGGSGSSGQEIDINGNGGIDADEANVRSVPTRLTLAVPPLKACNATVTLTDTGVTSPDDLVTAINFNNGGIGGGATLTDSATYKVTADVTGEGQVCNEALLKGEENCSDCSVKVIIGYDQTQPIYDGETIIGYAPIYYEFPCCKPVDSSASACISVGGAQPAFKEGDYCTYTASGGTGWANPGANGGKGDLEASFYTVYPSAPTATCDNATHTDGALDGGFVEVGIPGESGFSMKFQAQCVNSSNNPSKPNWHWVDAAECILGLFPDNANSPAALIADLINPETTSSRILGLNVLALQLNADFSHADVLGDSTLEFGDLTLCNLETGSVISSGYVLTAEQAAILKTKTVKDILDDANTALGGGGLPDYVGSFANLNDLLDKLNGAFTGCDPGTFATTYMCKP